MTKTSKYINILFALIMSGCAQNQVNVSEFIQPTFNGFDGYGYVSAELDKDAVANKEYDLSYDYLGNEEKEIIDGIVNSVDIYIPDNEMLSNGDEVQAEIKVMDEAKTYIPEETQTFTVADLPQGNVLTQEEMAAAIRLNTYGTSGQGYGVLEIDQNFPSEYQSLEITPFDENGTLSNGDTLRVHFTQESLDNLADIGYGIAQPFFDFEVTNLPVVALHFDDLSNKVDVLRFIDDKVSERITKRESGKPDIRHVAYMYRAFEPNVKRHNRRDAEDSNDGSVIKIYYVTKKDDKGSIKDEYYETYELGKLFVNEEHTGNIAMTTQNAFKADKDYSDTSIIQYYETLGYELIEEEGANE